MTAEEQSAIRQFLQDEAQQRNEDVRNNAERQQKIAQKKEAAVQKGRKQNKKPAPGSAAARGKIVDPMDGFIDYGDDLIDFGNFDDEIDYTDDLYRGMTNAKPVAADEVIGMAQKGKQTAARVAQTAKASSARTTFRQLSVAENLIRDPKNIKMTALAATLGAGALGYGYSRRRNR